MKTEKEKMLAGEMYRALDPELTRDRQTVREHCRALAACPAHHEDERRRIIAAIFGAVSDAWIEPPFHCDYGKNIRLGRRVFFNFNCVVLDVLPVTIGDDTMFGPAVQLYTAMHPLDADARRGGLEFGKPVTIGRDVWVGGGAIICPGVTIDDRCVIGAGAVVTKDVPADAFAAGNPARVVRMLR